MIWLILLLGLILRLISLNQSLWLDEAINITAAKSFALFDLITKYATADFHPPGYFALIWFWGRLGNFSEIWMRVPSVIFGVLTIWIVYLIGKRLFSKDFALLASLLLAVNPLHIYYSQEARMYSFAAFAVSLNLYLFLRLINGDKINARFLILSNFLILVSDYVAYLIFPAQFAILLLSKQLEAFKNWLASFLLSLLLFTFWIPVLLSQLNTGSSALTAVSAWKNVVGAFGLKTLALTYVKFIIGRIGYPDRLIYIIFFLPVGLLTAYVLYRAYKFQKAQTTRFGLFLIIPIVLAQLISLVIPIYSYFRLLFLLPIFVLILALGLSSFKKGKIILISVFIAIELFCSAVYLTNPIFQREDWRGVVSFLGTRPGSKVLFESTDSFPPFDYYASNTIYKIGALKNFSAKDPFDVVDLKPVLKGSNDVYLVDYLVEVSDPQRLVSKQLEELGYKIGETKNFNGVGFVYHYVK